MHCSDEELAANKSDIQEHISCCIKCQQRSLQLNNLKIDADNLPAYQPTEFAWIKVKASIPKNKKPNKFMVPLTIAASFVVGIIVTFVANNAWQDHVIEQLVYESNTYEQKLVSMKLAGVLMEQDLWEVSQIDQQLNLKHSKSSKKKLWLKRNKALKNILINKTRLQII